MIMLFRKDQLKRIFFSGATFIAISRQVTNWFLSFMVHLWLKTALAWQLISCNFFHLLPWITSFISSSEVMSKSSRPTNSTLTCSCASWSQEFSYHSWQKNRSKEVASQLLKFWFNGKVYPLTKPLGSSTMIYLRDFWIFIHEDMNDMKKRVLS